MSQQLRVPGSIIGLVIAGAALFFYLIETSLLIETGLSTTAQYTATAPPDYTWSKLSSALTELQHNITTSVLQAIETDINNKDSMEKSLFRRDMERFPWAETVDALDKGDPKSVSYLQQLLDALVPHLVMPPPETRAVPCQPPLLINSSIDCSHHLTALTGVQRRIYSTPLTHTQTPAKVAHILQLGFDADVLEIQLNELDPVVDRIFVMESTRTHNKNLRKPLLWDRMKGQPRFQRITDKVVHIVLDDVDALAATQNDIWGLERLQEERRWKAFLVWNNRTDGFFGPEDLVGFGDADEIPAARNVELLKRCEMAGPSVDIGAWFAWGGLDRAFKPDWPVPGHPWTLGDPTYWTVRSATAYDDDGVFPTRMRGTSSKYLLGGVHMTDNPYPPFLLAKTIACTECGEANHRLFRGLRECFAGEACSELDDEELMQKLLQMLDRSKPFHSRMKDIGAANSELGDAYYIPRYMQCYPNAFPGWIGGIDQRLLM